MSFHVDEYGEIKCDGYKKADNGVFSDDEKAEAYMLASQSIIGKENPKAAKLIEQYLKLMPSLRKLRLQSMTQDIMLRR